MLFRSKNVPDPHDPKKVVKEFDGFEQVSAGLMTETEYDSAMADLVSFMSWMAEPQQNERVRLGVWVLIYLAFFTVLAWFLNKAYWKDIH